MQNQTIDGVLVSRALLEQFLAGGRQCDREALRALLDAPECRTPTALACPGDGVGPCKECPGDKGRGEPVAYLDENGKFVFVGYEKLRTACWVDANQRAIPAAWKPLRAEHSAPVATIELGKKEVGNYGSLYDGPSVRRAYTYTHQPGNQAAAALGNAWLNTQRGGDSIDAGLSLLCQLERAGYGVFAL